MNKHKKLFAVLTLVCFLFTLMPIAVFAETEIIASGKTGAEGDNIVWTLDSEGILTLSGTGATDQHVADSVWPWVDYIGQIKKVIVSEGITELGPVVFASLRNLEEVVLPDTLTTINGNVFSNCSNLVSLEIPKNVTSIAGTAFAGCNGLTKLTVAEENSNFFITNNVLYEKLDIDKLRLVSYLPCNNVTEYTVKENVSVIGSNAFNSNDYLQKIILPEGLLSIEDNAFSSCTNLQSIDLPKSLQTIGSRAFYYCNQLTEITIPKNVVQIGRYPFELCSNLQNINVDCENTKYYSTGVDLIQKGIEGDILMGYAPASDNDEYTIPEKVTIILGNTFYNCGNLEIINIQENVNIIEPARFDKCNSLTAINVDRENQTFKSIDGVLFEQKDNELVELVKFPAQKNNIAYTVPSGVKRIDSDAFDGCNNLTAITLPESLTAVAGYEFDNCDSLTDIYYGADELTWNKIFIYPDSNFFENITIHFAVEICNNPISFGKSYVEIPKHAYALENIPLKFKFCDENGTLTTEKGSVYFWIEKDEEPFTWFGISFMEENGVTSENRYINHYNDLFCFGAVEAVSNNLIELEITYSGEYTIYYSFTEPGFSNGSIIAPENTKSHTITILDNHNCGDNATWTLNEDGILTISGTGKVTERTWDSRSDEIKSVVVEEGITELPWYAFDGLDNLEKIKLPASLEAVGASIVQGNDKLTEITVAAANGIFYAIDNVLYQKAENSSDIILVAYPAGKNDKRFVVSDNVTIIGEGAFAYCDNLEEIIIGKNVKQIIDIGVHYDSSNLKRIIVDSANSVYYSKDGVLYQKGSAGDILVSYPNNRAEKSFTVPDGVVEIHEHAFIGDNNLEKLALCEDVTTLGEGCFEECASLKKLYIPKSAVPIGSHLFAFSIALEDVYYGGTEEEWKQLLGNEFIWHEAVIHFNSTGIPSDSNTDTSSGSSSSGGSYTPSTNQSADDISISNTNSDIRVETSEVKDSVIDSAEKAVLQDSNTNLIGGADCAVNIHAEDNQGDVVNGFFTPLTVEIPVDGAALKTVDNIDNLTLAKVVTDESGVTTLVYMGGNYDTQTGLFTAYVDEAGDYVLVEDADVKKIELQIGNRSTEVNGEAITSDVEPRIIDNHTYVPLRYIAEILGCDVAWDEASRTVTITQNGITMKLVIDEEIEGYDVSAVIRENRTLVPLRYIAEQLGANVIWHPETQEIVVVK